MQPSIVELNPFQTQMKMVRLQEQILNDVKQEYPGVPQSVIKSMQDKIEEVQTLDQLQAAYLAKDHLKVARMEIIPLVESGEYMPPRLKDMMAGQVSAIVSPPPVNTPQTPQEVPLNEDNKMELSLVNLYLAGKGLTLEANEVMTDNFRHLNPKMITHSQKKAAKIAARSAAK
jgi:hypothetical protein